MLFHSVAKRYNWHTNDSCLKFIQTIKEIPPHKLKKNVLSNSHCSPLKSLEFGNTTSETFAVRSAKFYRSFTWILSFRKNRRKSARALTERMRNFYGLLIGHKTMQNRQVYWGIYTTGISTVIQITSAFEPRITELRTSESSLYGRLLVDEVFLHCIYTCLSEEEFGTLKW